MAELEWEEGGGGECKGKTIKDYEEKEQGKGFEDE